MIIAWQTINDDSMSISLTRPYRLAAFKRLRNIFQPFRTEPSPVSRGPGLQRWHNSSLSKGEGQVACGIGRA